MGAFGPIRQVPVRRGPSIRAPAGRQAPPPEVLTGRIPRPGCEARRESRPRLAGSGQSKAELKQSFAFHLLSAAFQCKARHGYCDENADILPAHFDKARRIAATASGQAPDFHPMSPDECSPRIKVPGAGTITICSCGAARTPLDAFGRSHEYFTRFSHILQTSNRPADAADPDRRSTRDIPLDCGEKGGHRYGQTGNRRRQGPWTWLTAA